MQMMYETVYKALVEVGLESTYRPEDYLNFFCLGNREAFDSAEGSNATKSVPANTSQVLSFFGFLKTFTLLTRVTTFAG